MNEIAVLIKERRTAAGLSQTMLARTVGVSPQLVSYWERGCGPVPSGRRAILASALNSSLEAFSSRGLSVERTRVPRAFQRRGRRARPSYPIGATLDDMLRLGRSAQFLQQKALTILPEDEYHELLTHYPRDTPYELLFAFTLVALGARLVWTCPRALRCGMMVLDDFSLEYAGDHMQWALLWQGDREWMVIFGQIRVRAAYLKGSARVDFLVRYQSQGKRAQWLYVELDGSQHGTQRSLDEERAENLLVPELRYDNLKLRSSEWCTDFMRDVRAKAIEGAKHEREHRKKSREWRQKREGEIARRRAEEGGVAPHPGRQTPSCR